MSLSAYKTIHCRVPWTWKRWKFWSGQELWGVMGRFASFVEARRENDKPMSIERQNSVDQRRVA